MCPICAVSRKFSLPEMNHVFEKHRATNEDATIIGHPRVEIKIYSR